MLLSGVRVIGAGVVVLVGLEDGGKSYSELRGQTKVELSGFLWFEDKADVDWVSPALCVVLLL